MTKHEPDLSRVFYALSDPTRRAMLQQLGQGALSLGHLAAPSGFSLPTVHRHLAVLQKADLVQTYKSGRRRMCAARPEVLDAAVGWLAQTRHKMAAQTDRLSDYLDILNRKTHEL